MLFLLRLLFGDRPGNNPVPGARRLLCLVRMFLPGISDLIRGICFPATAMSCDDSDDHATTVILKLRSCLTACLDDIAPRCRYRGGDGPPHDCRALNSPRCRDIIGLDRAMQGKSDLITTT